MSPDPDYDRMSDPELSRHMMPRLAVPDCDRWLEDGLALSQNLRTRITRELDQRYGPLDWRLREVRPTASSRAVTRTKSP